ncbi:MFS transporter [Streptomyces sp. HUAS YS2]|uniref:MFS transporter n=2 Tax=Streptomyces solicathayae TaxID=3081768 RepID=A0ABZ0M4N9_9ACTN|nr:MFS transporter [Streptomyces sp. HUAS YS2]WOX26712.1 MFS transporter [Streptomyces sp. HUAS YS2]
MPPAYAPTAPAGFGPPQGFGPPAAYPSPHPDTPGADPRRRRGLVVAAFAQFSVLFATLAFAMAIPEIQSDLGLGSVNPLSGLYALAFGGLLLLGGHLADVRGARRTLTIGLAGYIAVSAVVGFLPDSTTMLVARALQGASAALVVSAGLSLVVGGFTDPKERGRAFGVYAAVAVGGTVLAMTVGGLLTEFVGWRVVLLAALPFAVTALILARTLPADGPNRVPFDMAGTLLGCAGMLALTYGVTLDAFGTGTGMSGGPSLLTVVPTVAGIGLLAGFLVRQFTMPGGFATGSEVRTADRVGGLVGLVMVGAAVAVTFWSLSIHLQHALGMAPVAAGTALLPMAAALAIGCFVAARLADRVPQRVPVTGGLVAAALGLALLTRLDAGSGGYVGWVLPGLIVVGLGVGLALGPLLDVATAGVPLPFAGSAAATAVAAQGIGETIGGALLASSPPVLSEPDGNGYYRLLGPSPVPLWCAAGALLVAAVVAGTTLTKRPPAGANR